MTLDEIKKALEGHEKKDDLVTGIVNLINKETETGKSKVKEVKKDLEKAARYKKAFESLGFDGSIDVSDFAAGIREKIEDTGKSGSEVESLQAQLKATNKKLEKLSDDYTAERAKNVRSTLEKKVAERLTKDNRKWIGSSLNLLTRGLIDDGKVSLSDSGEMVFKNGEDVIDLDEGFKGVIEQNKDLIANDQKPGGGSNPGAGGTGGSGDDEDRIKQVANNVVADGW